MCSEKSASACCGGEEGEQFKRGPQFYSCPGIVRDLGFHLAPHTSVQLLPSLLGMQEMDGLRGRGIYFINKWRDFHFFFLKCHKIRK